MNDQTMDVMDTNKASATNPQLLITYTLHVADNAVIMSQRLSEWTGHGPALEQDIALTNIALDYLGQARNFYQHAAMLINEHRLMPAFAPGRTYPLQEDDLAYHRLEHQFSNHLLVELPNDHWGQTVLKVFFFAHHQMGIYQQLLKDPDPQVAAIAEKSLKEVKYHVKWSSDWVLRLGDGTEESHEKMQKALQYLWPFTGEFFEKTSWNEDRINLEALQQVWDIEVQSVLEQSTLLVPSITRFQTGGLKGIHTENLGFLLAEMQYLQRVYPDSNW